MNLDTRQRCGTCPPSKQNKMRFTCQQGRINHWANRSNVRGLALLGASRLNIKSLLYTGFSCF